MNTNTTSAAGLYAALAGIVVLILGYLGVPVTDSQAVTIIADVAIIIGTIHGLVAHKNLVAGYHA
jgi:hypothetical protein